VSEAKHTETEVALCDRIRAWAEGLGFEVYPEIAGWDLVLVTSAPRALDRDHRYMVSPGDQVGIHAKLRANCDVLSQAVPGDFATYGPTFPMVGVPVAGGAFKYIAERLGVGVIEAPAATDAFHGYGNVRVSRFPRRSKMEPLSLPPVASRAIQAGAPSPRQLSPWRIKALRFLAFARAADGQRFAASDIKAHGLSKDWVDRWGIPVDWTTEVRRGKSVRVRVYRLIDAVEKLPDHGYEDVAAELAAADAKGAA
jgi:hypothetical protein